MVYNIHNDKAISKDLVKGTAGYLYIVEKHRNEILNYCGRETLGRHYFDIALSYLNIGDYLHAVEFFRKTKEFGVQSKLYKFITYI